MNTLAPPDRPLDNVISIDAARSRRARLRQRPERPVSSGRDERSALLTFRTDLSEASVRLADAQDRVHERLAAVDERLRRIDAS